MGHCEFHGPITTWLRSGRRLQWQKVKLQALSISTSDSDSRSDSTAEEPRLLGFSRPGCPLPRLLPTPDRQPLHMHQHNIVSMRACIQIDMLSGSPK